MRGIPKIIVSLRCDYCRKSGVFRFDSYREFKDFNFHSWDLWKEEVLHGECSKMRHGGNVSEQDVLAKGRKRKKEMRDVPSRATGASKGGKDGP